MGRVGSPCPRGTSRSQINRVNVLAFAWAAFVCGGFPHPTTPPACLIRQSAGTDPAPRRPACACAPQSRLVAVKRDPAFADPDSWVGWAAPAHAERAVAKSIASTCWRSRGQGLPTLRQRLLASSANLPEQIQRHLDQPALAHRNLGWSRSSVILPSPILFHG
jgi:hypothetical protein